MGEDQSPCDPNSRNCPSPTSSTTGECDNLRRVISELTSLISLSYAIRVFSVKWQLIRKRLEELNSGLITFENTHSSNSFKNSTMVDLVALAYCLVRECQDLASRCISVSYNGKLLMQSELDKVVAKLDLVLNKLFSRFETEGMLSGGLALVVSRPPVGATREEMTFYIKDLQTRIKIGESLMKHQALLSLNQILSEDDKYVKNVVELPDFVLLLVTCLDSSDSKIQEEATVAVGFVASFDSYKGLLVVSGAIAPLVRVLESGSFKSKEFSVRSLIKLTENGDNAWALSAHGGVTALLNMCSREDDNPELIGPSCWVLRNVVVVVEIKRFMIEEGAIATFIKLIDSRNELAQIGSAEFLQALASRDENVRQLVIKGGEVRALVRVLDPKSSFSFKARESALRAIENLCFCSVDHVNLLISYGFMDQLLSFLREEDASVQELAFKSAYRLCGTSEEVRKLMGDAGFMAEFANFLEGKSYVIREMAAETLSRMVMVPRNRKKFANDGHSIGLVLQLLDPKEGHSGNIKFLLSMLLSLSNCNHARKVISHSGYLNNIEKLADAGVSDAQKILRKLSASRFKSILTGFWHS